LDFFFLCFVTLGRGLCDLVVFLVVFLVTGLEAPTAGVTGVTAGAVRRIEGELPFPEHVDPAGAGAGGPLGGVAPGTDQVPEAGEYTAWPVPGITAYPVPALIVLPPGPPMTTPLPLPSVSLLAPPKLG
jgi:hypothetical protein